MRVARGDVKEGLPDFDRAIELDPGRALAYANRGWARLLLGDKPGGDKDFEQCFKLDPALRVNLEGLVNQTRKTAEKRLTLGKPLGIP
jgi:hypothetical protein